MRRVFQCKDGCEIGWCSNVMMGIKWEGVCKFGYEMGGCSNMKMDIGRLLQHNAYLYIGCTHRLIPLGFFFKSRNMDIRLFVRIQVF